MVDAALDSFLPPESAPPGRLAEAMRYSVFAGGKRFRPVLAILVCEALGGSRDDVMPGACALEMVHTYSLIHDDLPAMDDDDFRRGKPSSHKAFGEALAILAGDALLTYAFEVAALSARSPAAIVLEIARGAGPAGMVAGQVADMDAEGSAVTGAAGQARRGAGLRPGSLGQAPLECRSPSSPAAPSASDAAGQARRGAQEAGEMRARLEYIHRNKTAALIRAAARVGAVAAGAPEEGIDAAGRFGEALGLLFQITDDVLDVTAESEALGKTAGKDAAAGKLTYPSVVGLEAARAEARAEARRALEFLEHFAPAHTILQELVGFVLERTS